jgi:hypothetical protein
VTDKTSLNPIVSFVNLPETIAFQDTAIGFQVQVEDPASTQDSGPTMGKLEFSSQGNTGRNNVLDAHKAVSCQGPAQWIEGNKWIFQCTLTLTDIKNVDSKMSKSAIAGFIVNVEGSNGKPGRKQTTFTVTPKTGV